MKHFSKELMSEVQKKLDNVIKETLAEYGLMHHANYSNVTDNGFHVSINITSMDDSKKDEFCQLCHRYGFEESDYLKTFKDGKYSYQLTGFNPKAPKNNCNLYCIENGKTYIAAASYVKDCFQKTDNPVQLTEKEEFAKVCKLYGFKESDYGKEYTVRGKTYRFVGFDKKSRKNRCIVLCLNNNTRYNTTPDTVKKELHLITDEQLELELKQEFALSCYVFGFKPEDFKKEINLMGEKYQLIGFLPKARKNQCRIIRVKDGREYCTTIENCR